MPEQTFAEAFEKFKQAVEAQTTLGVLAPDPLGSEKPWIQPVLPNPDFTPLLALVRESHLDSFGWHVRPGGIGLDGFVPETCTCYPTGFASRVADWQAADKGALEGAFIKAIPASAPVGLQSELMRLLWATEGDTRIAATQAVTAWLEESTR